MQSNRYSRLEQLESNRFFSLYRGTDSVTGKPVVIKKINVKGSSRTELVLFREEYKNIKAIDSAHLAEVLEIVEDTDAITLVFRDIPGTYITVPLPVEIVIQIAIQLADILISFHTARIVHGNISLKNIFMHENFICLTTPLAELSVNRHDEAIYDDWILSHRIPYLSPEQSGRMNRSIDYRTDFYSLGVVMYQMITGGLPFEYSDMVNPDPLELFHAHIAVAPPGFDKTIPPVISSIVMKLLSKNAEERYLSAAGIKHDLEKCAGMYNSSGAIENFKIAQQDSSSDFRIIEKLYGREVELDTLLSTFDRIYAGSSELVFVAGYSGIGKTTLISEMYKPIVHHRGYFVSGKYDQYMKDTPYSAFIQALQMLIRQILSEDESRLAKWRSSILESLGINGQVIIDVIPELALVTGTQPAVIELAPAESRNRFNLYFQRFISVFCSASHPLTIFLDDLQWADLASLDLIKNLVCDNESKHLFILGAYRDNEVSPIHPLILTAEEINKKVTREIISITLGPLTREHTSELISDSLKASLDEAAELSRLVYHKTLGNPFFIKEFLKTLHKDGMLWWE